MLLCKIFKLQSFDPQEYKCAGPSTRLIWCGTCLKSRFSNRENIPWDKSDLVEILNTPNNFFLVLPSQITGKSLEIGALHNFFYFSGFWCHVSFNTRLSPSKSYRYHLFPSSWCWGIPEIWGHFDITKYWDQ